MSKTTSKAATPMKRNLTIRVKDLDDPEAVITNMMMDPRYLRQSSTLIQEALQKGFDVLQLANGDIVCTGTKTIVERYTWEDSKGKLSRIKSDKKTSKKESELESLEEEEEA